LEKKLQRRKKEFAAVKQKIKSSHDVPLLLKEDLSKDVVIGEHLLLIELK